MYPKNVSLSPSSLSSETSSLISTNSSCSKSSQLTDQLYNCDSESNPVVQVCVRVRPMNRFECNNQLIKRVVEIDETDSILNFKHRRNPAEIRYKFKFNHLFYSKYNKTLEDNQEEIYSKIGRPYIENILEGNDLCYFAYGQTGSGKSYTIMGDESTPGLVFRFAKQLFEIAELNEHKDLDQLIHKLNANNSSTVDQTDATPVNENDSTNHILLEAKKQLYEMSEKYGFTDVIDFAGSPDSSLKHQEHNARTERTKDKILRFDENIKCYKDDHMYNERLFSSDSEYSSLDSFNSLDLNEQLLEQEFKLINHENLGALKTVLIKYGNQKERLKIDFSFKISFYEIYSESIYDLLEPGEERIKSKVREHPTSGPYIVNLTMKKITSMKELNLYYELGNKRRSKGSTTSNDQSSRSHAIFTIYVTQTHHYEPITVTTDQESPRKSPSSKTRTTELHSKLSFVDLAGSERATANDQPTDERLKEGNSINKSLLTFGKVITKLAWINKCIKKRCSEFDVAKNSNNPLFYVPYRDSILTWLLKDYFNGKCKTFMIATVAPTSNHYDQTLSTLRYAHKASKIKVSFKFNQVIVSSQLLDDQKLNDSSIKRLYIEHMDSLRDKMKRDRLQSTPIKSTESVTRVQIDSPDQRPEIVSKIVNQTYKSILIEKIKEIFKDTIPIE